MRTESTDPWENPKRYLLSYKKRVTASSFMPGHGPENAADENVRTWWQAASASTEEWLELDLGNVFDVRAIQVNFADDKLEVPVPGTLGETGRYIDDAPLKTCWLLEGSADGRDYRVIEDRTQVLTDLSHDFLVYEEGMSVRFLRLRAEGATGYNVLWGSSPQKLYHSYMCFENELRVGALVQGRRYYVRVDAFNENGITEGKETVLV